MSSSERSRGGRAALLLLIGMLAAAGCARAPRTGPGPVRWDRQTCARCSMVVSERRHAAQVRGAAPGRRPLLHHFDDIGCALAWLDAQPWGHDPGVEIWVAGDDLSWLDARRAFFETGGRSPMDYRLAAREEPAEGRLDLEQAWEQVRRIDLRQGRAREDRSQDAGDPS